MKMVVMMMLTNLQTSLQQTEAVALAAYVAHVLFLGEPAQLLLPAFASFMHSQHNWW